MPAPRSLDARKPNKSKKKIGRSRDTLEREKNKKILSSLLYTHTYVFVHNFTYTLAFYMMHVYIYIYEYIYKYVCMGGNSILSTNVLFVLKINIFEKNK